MEITEERINAAYSVADENMKKVLDALFADKTAKDDRPVTERVKTFDDAVKEIGEDHPYVKALRATEETGDENLVQYCRLRIITMALNEGWTPKFTEGEYRYWPYFWLYKDEADALVSMVLSLTVSPERMVALAAQSMSWSTPLTA